MLSRVSDKFGCAASEKGLRATGAHDTLLTNTDSAAASRRRRNTNFGGLGAGQ